MVRSAPAPRRSAAARARRPPARSAATATNVPPMRPASTGRAAPNANVCGNTCLDAPCNANQCLVCNQQQGTCVTTCTNPDLPNCCNGTCRECCNNNQCAPSEICLNFTCCATANVCGNVCLDAPCDTSECQQCNPNTGACVSTCTADETCCGGDCVPTASLCGSICGNVCEAPTPNCCGTECEECCNNSQCNEAGCEICSGNQCVSKCSGETPDCNGSGTCICNAVSCVGGCCNTTTGACVDYDDQTDTICGASGNCAACDTANCFHCNASDGTCDFGCSGSTPVCNGSGVCVECTQNSDCNENLCEICSGNQCVSKCSGETPDCSGSGTCICNATSCVGGCWQLDKWCVRRLRRSDGRHLRGGRRLRAVRHRQLLPLRHSRRDVRPCLHRRSDMLQRPMRDDERPLWRRLRQCLYCWSDLLRQ